MISSGALSLRGTAGSSPKHSAQFLSSSSQLRGDRVALQPGKAGTTPLRIPLLIQANQASNGQGQGRRGYNSRRRGGGKGGGKGGGGARRKVGSKNRTRTYIRSDGIEHLGSSLRQKGRPFPGPTGGQMEQDLPLRILPIGGLGEIGMNCMLVGHYDRYILLDAGLMFPDYDELGIQKVLPDISFIAQYRDKIEAVFITHGHEDHIGALPWVIPALDPRTPVFSGGFTMQLVKRRMMEYNLWNPDRFRTVKVGDRFQAGPFEIEPIRVTHSIPDCFGCVMRCADGNILHTGDWKIDETPVDGQVLDRARFQELGNEGITLMMSDSTNVLSPGRTTSEKDVSESLMQQVQGVKGRIIATQFASNLHRIHSMKNAADSVGRKLCFMGASLNTYLEAAWKNNTAPFDPALLIDPSEIDDMPPDKLMIITTGSQAEPMAMLNMASKGASRLLELTDTDTLLYSAKTIPGNEKRVMRMINKVSSLGTEIVMGNQTGLHTSGHAHRGELEEILQLVRPQHFLPVHGEYAFLIAHEQLAKETGIVHTDVIRNGGMIAVGDRRSRNEISSGSGLGIVRCGGVPLIRVYNDGNNATGNKDEMFMEERMSIATEGIIIASIAVVREIAGREGVGGLEFGEEGLRGSVKITTRALWTDGGKTLQVLQTVGEQTLGTLRRDSTLVHIERTVSDRMRKYMRTQHKKRPDVICIAHESADDVAAQGSLSRGGDKAGKARPGMQIRRKPKSDKDDAPFRGI
ncbi:hypothetical protein CYMTET_16025 [Cymbomonas tetramitiformis]|uniref:Metallo-beta-lactamase domain-containing protein n=1 Tax=Cymbomonas tetramitiformis TaxID=36881 RepID=A0AAE0GCT5_9CHLO|nr:hypothetical protein CYMTET_16025 [Cymbomonas tetramitiformis]